MREVKTIMALDKKIYIIDYTGCNESQMINLLSNLKQQLLTEDKPQLVLSIFNDKVFTTPTFIRHAYIESDQVIHLIKKMAFTGLNFTKKLILKGYNFRFGRDFRSFNTQDEAIHYLSDDVSLEETPAYFKTMKWP